LSTDKDREWCKNKGQQDWYI